MRFPFRGIRIFLAGLLLAPALAVGHALKADPALNYTGLWWNPAESGWGINLNHQGNILFATLFTYDAAGAPLWLVMSAGSLQPDGATFKGELYRTSGPPFNAVPFTPITAANNVPVGTMSVTFSGANAAFLAYTVNGTAVTKSIQPLVFGTRAAACVATTGSRASLTNYQDLWWNAAESGWGLNLAHQDNTLFATLFTYDATGKGLWLVMSAGTRQADGAYLGDLYRTSGSPFDAQPYTPITAAGFNRVGTMQLRFADGNTGSLVYSVNGVAVSKAITRLVFSSPVPSCSSSGTAASVPGTPTGLLATPGDGSVSIAFTAPVSDGGSAITAYTATCTAAGQSASATANASPVTVSGLANGTAYTCSLTASNAVGTGMASDSIVVTPAAGARFVLTSTAGSDGGTLPADYTCDGPGSSLALAWSNAPAGTKEFAVLMTTLPGDGTTKWNWVLYGIPAGTTGLARDSFGIGTAGVGSDGPIAAYQPPCSQGPGAKRYTFTVYALSSSPSLSVPAGQVTGAVLASAMAPITLGSASLNLSYTRTTATGSAPNCLNVRNSTAASSTGNATVGCDATYAYFGSNGLATHAMMNGITATNLQVPTAQNFFGANAWKIPLNPAVAATTTTAIDGPIGVAINGVPIFNPCKQGGCQNGDTKVLGELDICNGHAGRADDYHYHAAPTCLMAGKPASYWDTHPLGWALDGFAIFGYNNADGTVATRDGVCGGNTSTVLNAPSGYSYHVTDASPYVLSCFRGTPSPDLAGQGAKYRPMRQPPVTPFPVAGMTLTTDAADGYQVLQFSSARPFTTTETGTDSYANAPGTYRIRYRQVTGTALAALLALAQNSGKSACWNFQFVDGAGATTQPTVAYCR